MNRKRKLLVVSSLILFLILGIMFTDIDVDGLFSYREVFETKTNPFEKDTDSDRLSDGKEISLRTNPLAEDTDGDGLVDGDEVEIHNTNPLLHDSDNDRIDDLREISLGTDPTCPDTDGDGLSDLESFPLDPNRPSLQAEPQSVDIVKGSWRPKLQVTFKIKADGTLLDQTWIYSTSEIISRLNWNEFDVFVNEKKISYSKTLFSVYCYLDLTKSINVTVRCNDVCLSRHFTAVNSSYSLVEIMEHWNSTKMSVEPVEGSAFDSMQKAFDEYAKVISGLIFMRTHISGLKSSFMSIENWLLWLYETFHGASSFDSAWSNFQKYANASGVQKLVEQVWIELLALRTFPWDSLSKYPSIRAESSWNIAIEAAIDYFQVPVGTLDSLEWSIETCIKALEEIYVHLASEFFGWVSNTSTVEETASNAHGAQWYIDNLQEIRRASPTAFQSHGFGRIIEPRYQFIHVGESGVAWWPSHYSCFYTYTNTPYYSENIQTEFPLTEIHWIRPKSPAILGGEETVIYKIFLATESIVLNHLKNNGFQVRYMPPTEGEKIQFEQTRQISKFFVKKLDHTDKIFLNDDTLANELATCSKSFANFDLVSDTLTIVRKYGSVESFLEHLNQNVWLLT